MGGTLTWFSLADVQKPRSPQGPPGLLSRFGMVPWNGCETPRDRSRLATASLGKVSALTAEQVLYLRRRFSDLRSGLEPDETRWYGPTSRVEKGWNGAPGLHWPLQHRHRTKDGTTAGLHNSGRILRHWCRARVCHAKTCSTSHVPVPQPPQSHHPTAPNFRLCRKPCSCSAMSFTKRRIVHSWTVVAPSFRLDVGNVNPARARRRAAH